MEAVLAWFIDLAQPRKARTDVKCQFTAQRMSGRHFAQAPGAAMCASTATEMEPTMKTISALVLSLLLSAGATGYAAAAGGNPPAAPQSPGAGPMAGNGTGPGAMAGQRMGPRWGSESTPGWALMNGTERDAHLERLRSMKTYEECHAYMEQHREQMAARAKEQGKAALRQPRRDACAGLKR